VTGSVRGSSANGGSANGGSVNGRSVDGVSVDVSVNGGSTDSIGAKGGNLSGSSVNSGSMNGCNDVFCSSSIKTSIDMDKEEVTDYRGMDVVLKKFLANYTAKNLDENGDLKPGCHRLDPNTIPYDAIVCAFVRDNKQGYEDKSRSGSDGTCSYIRVREQASDKDEAAAVMEVTQVKEAVESNVNDNDESYEVVAAKEVEAAVNCGTSVRQRKRHDPFTFFSPIAKPAQVKQRSKTSLQMDQPRKTKNVAKVKMRTRKLANNQVTSVSVNIGQRQVPKRLKQKKSTCKRRVETRLTLKLQKRPRMKVLCKMIGKNQIGRAKKYITELDLFGPGRKPKFRNYQAGSTQEQQAENDQPQATSDVSRYPKQDALPLYRVG
jgi:hypothetical protein